MASEAVVLTNILGMLLKAGAITSKSSSTFKILFDGIATIKADFQYE